MSSSVITQGSAASTRPNTFSEHQHYIQQILAVTTASISILFALVAFYFFMKVQTLLFRHHLIILLIISDLFKAIWYLIPPVVIFVQHSATGHKLCQASGLLLTAGIEASDFIILLIAIHTALSVLRPGKTKGLYNYRYIAYACWLGISILLPSLAFINQGDAFVSQGTVCYLPIRPVWYRLVLAWIPRYLILISIMVIYITIYLYTQSEFGKVDINLTDTDGTSLRRSDDIPNSSTSAEALPPSRHLWTQPTGQPLPTEEGPMESTISTVFADPMGPEAPPDQTPEPLRRKQTLLEALRDKSFLPKRAGEPIDTNHKVRKRHRAIKRQLRYMFIYPLTYALMWFPPFINHCYFYTAKHNPPFALSCVSLVSISLHCAVDCLIFGIREKPWRYRGEKTQRSRRFSGKGSENDTGANGGAIERAIVPEHTVAVDGSRAKPERNWWDQEI